MILFLLWRRPPDPQADPDPARVAATLQEIFAPLFEVPPPIRTLQNDHVTLVSLELPVRGWKAPYFEEDRRTWALAPDYPINARAVLVARGTDSDDDGVLPALGRGLEADPDGHLRDLTPPFSLIWSDKATGATFAQNDGLGQSQLYEWEEGRSWALTNKVAALRALGCPLEPVPEQWAVRATLGWFPLDLTGYRGVRFVEPGTRLQIDLDGLRRTPHDVLSGWVRPGTSKRQDGLELARASLHEHLAAARSLCERPSLGLTGGWDSRAVAAAARAVGVRFSARVRGLPGRPDVRIASELARVAGLDLRVKASGGLPPDSPDACRRSIRLALLWQAGHMVSRRHKTFLAGRPHLDGGDVNIMGQHGELVRGFYAKEIAAAGRSVAEGEPAWLDVFMSWVPAAIRPALHEPIRQALSMAFRRADRFGLTGRARFDFFYLMEDTRRWASGSLASQPGVVVAPFLNPGMIRAGFGDPADDLTDNPFHRHIIEADAPEWKDIPYAEDLEPAAEGGWKQPVGKQNYDSTLYWRSVGRPIIRDAFSRGGFWTEVYDPDLAREGWADSPDDFAIAHSLPDVLRT